MTTKLHAPQPSLPKPSVAAPPIPRRLEPESTVELPSVSATVAPRYEHAFLHQLRTRVESAVEGELSGTDWTAQSCPWLEYWFAYYEARPEQHLEAALRKYVGADPHATRDDLAEPVLARIRGAVARWRVTGEVDAPEAAIPEEVDMLARLGPGRPLDAAVRSRMEQATGTPLGDTRVHTDGSGASAASREGTRAFAIGNHVAFGAGEYRPGTIEGDALIAHELAHTVQQRGATKVGVGGGAGFERSADRFAAGALGRLWRRDAAPIDHSAGGTTGLRLQRCGGKKDDDKATPTPTPVTPPTPVKPPAWTKPVVSVGMTGHDYVGKGKARTRVDAVRPEDVVGELAGEPFELREEHDAGGKKYAAKTKVIVKAWDLMPEAGGVFEQKRTDVVVMLESDPSVELTVPKWNLRPVAARGAGIALYQTKTNIDTQAKVVRKRQDELAAFTGRASDKKDLEDLVRGKVHALDVLQIQQSMFNRFDKVIEEEVAAANKKHASENFGALDPNIVKSIMFRETQMGTFGAFLDDQSGGRDHRIMNHWNATQAIDSYGEMYAHLLVEEFPAIAARHGLTGILDEEKKKRGRIGTLTEMKRRPPDKQRELDGLVAEFTDAQGRDSSEPFYRNHANFEAALVELWGTGAVGGALPLNQTYRHWIHMLILELFVKRKIRKSWAATVEFFNGQSESYRKEVMDRVDEAKKALSTDDPIIPKHDGD